MKLEKRFRARLSLSNPYLKAIWVSAFLMSCNFADANAADTKSESKTKKVDEKLAANNADTTELETVNVEAKSVLNSPNQKIQLDKRLAKSKHVLV
jgi:hypothetical protein